MSQKENQVRRAIEQLVEDLKAKGVNVTDAGYVRIPTEQAQNPEIQKQVNQLVSKMLNTFGIPESSQNIPIGGKKVETENTKTTNTENPEDQEGPCFCPNCFNFDNFEKVYEGGKFDYAEVTLGGKPFSIKYGVHPTYGEHIFITEKFVMKTSTTEELHEQLNAAVQSKQFDKAQEILNELNNRKTNL